MFKWCLLQVCLLGLLVYWITGTTDLEARSLAALRFPAHEPRPCLAEVNERYTSLSHHLMSFPVVDKREMARVNRAYQYLKKKLGDEEATWDRMRDALLNRPRQRRK
jgi:hypothetical protein